jgi:hypothetical protein
VAARKHVAHTPLDLHTDHLDPPDGRYPFFEWEDLGRRARWDLVEKTLVNTYHRHPPNAVHGLLSDIALTADSLEELITEAMLAWANNDAEEAYNEQAARQMEADRVTFLEANPHLGHLGRVPSGWLDAMPRDIARAEHLVKMGPHRVRKATFNQPIPRYVMTNHEGQPIRGGQMVYGITVSDSEKVYDTSLKQNRYEYRWVIFE